MVWLFIGSASGAVAQPGPTSIQQGPIAGNGEWVPAYVNSGGLRLRDFPSTTDGRVVAVLNEGQQLEVSAVTGWRDRIGGAAFPWYHVTVANANDLVGWVYGQYVSAPSSRPPGPTEVQIVSRPEMNRTLLVLQMFRRLLGTDSREVTTSWLQSLREVHAVPPQIAFPTDYALRDYKTGFGELIIRFHSQDKLQLVLSITVDRKVGGLLIALGEPVARVTEVLGSDYYSQGQTLFYRGIPGIETYGVTVQTAHGVVTAISANALVE